MLEHVLIKHKFRVSLNITCFKHTTTHEIKQADSYGLDLIIVVLVNQWSADHHGDVVQVATMHVLPIDTAMVTVQALSCIVYTKTNMKH